MLVDALLAYLHFAAILGAVVFITSQAALCRSEWLNAAVVERLVRVERIYRGALAAVVLTGVLRWVAGIHGPAFVSAQPLFHLKMVLVLVLLVMAWKPARNFARWRQMNQEIGSLPASSEIEATRRHLMLAAHLMMLVPLAAALMARGWWF